MFAKHARAVVALLTIAIFSGAIVVGYVFARLRHDPAWFFYGMGIYAAIGFVIFSIAAVVAGLRSLVIGDQSIWANRRRTRVERLRRQV